jgi:MFS family permease
MGHPLPSSPTSSPSGRSGVPVVAMAVAATILGVLPVFLLGGLAVQVRDELGLSEAGLGIAVSTFFATSALMSVPGGRLSERIGAERGILFGAVNSLLSLAGVALVATSLPLLLACMAIGGIGNGVTQPAANLGVARQISPRRQGLAFGLKQSSIPIATLLGGLAVPLIALTVGWRWAYAGGGAFAGLLAVWALSRGTSVRRLRTPTGVVARSQLRGLLRLAIAGGLASAAANSLGAFLVLWGVTAGLAPGLSGLLFAAGSGFSILTRISLGGVADARPVSALAIVGGLLLSGAVGFALLATGSLPWVYLVGTLLGFGAGWGWPGLFNLAIVRTHGEAPAAATGVTQTGVYAGGVIGPPLFGLVVESFSYHAAWAAGATALAIAAVLVFTGGRKDRPPAADRGR